MAGVSAQESSWKEVERQNRESSLVGLVQWFLTGGVSVQNQKILFHKIISS